LGTVILHGQDKKCYSFFPALLSSFLNTVEILVLTWL